MSGVVLPAHAQTTGSISCSAIFAVDGDGGSGSQSFNEGSNVVNPGAFSGTTTDFAEVDIEFSATLFPPIAGQSIALNVDQVSVDTSSGNSDTDGIFSDAGGGVGDIDTSAITNALGQVAITVGAFDDASLDQSDRHDGATLTLTATSAGYDLV